MLVLVARTSAPLTTLVPAFIAITIAGPPFSAATVIAALLSLLVATFQIYRPWASRWPSASGSCCWPA